MLRSVAIHAPSGGHRSLHPVPMTLIAHVVKQAISRKGTGSDSGDDLSVVMADIFLYAAVWLTSNSALVYSAAPELLGDILVLCTEVSRFFVVQSFGSGV